MSTLAEKEKYQKFITYLTELKLLPIIDLLANNGFDDWETIQILPKHFLNLGIKDQTIQQSILASIAGADAYNLPDQSMAMPHEEEEESKVSISKPISFQMILTGSCLKMAKDEDPKKFRLRITNLYIKGKNLACITGIEDLKNLQILDLQKNNLVKIEGLNMFYNLFSLNLERNQIKKLEGLQNLNNLKKLYLNHNCIERVENLTNNPNIEVLWVSHQNIGGLPLTYDKDSMMVIGKNTKELESIGNHMNSIENLEYLTGLEYLNLKENDLSNLDTLFQHVQLVLKGSNYKKTLWKRFLNLEIKQL